MLFAENERKDSEAVPRSLFSGNLSSTRSLQAPSPRRPFWSWLQPQFCDLNRAQVSHGTLNFPGRRYQGAARRFVHFRLTYLCLGNTDLPAFSYQFSSLRKHSQWLMQFLRCVLVRSDAIYPTKKLKHLTPTLFRPPKTILQGEKTETRPPSTCMISHS